jgi:hypothetical protein
LFVVSRGCQAARAAIKSNRGPAKIQKAIAPLDNQPITTASVRRRLQGYERRRGKIEVSTASTNGKIISFRKSQEAGKE